MSAKKHSNPSIGASTQVPMLAGCLKKTCCSILMFIIFSQSHARLVAKIPL